MTDTDGLLQRLRALTRCEHSDLSIGDEAADEIERLRAEVATIKDSLTVAESELAALRGRMRDCGKCGRLVVDEG